MIHEDDARFEIQIILESPVYRVMTMRDAEKKLEMLRADAPMTIQKDGASMWWWLDRFVYEFEKKEASLFGGIHLENFGKVETSLCAREFAYKMLEIFGSEHFSMVFTGSASFRILP